MTRDQAKKLADETISGILLQSAVWPGPRGFSEVEALCYAFSALTMQRAFQKAGLADDGDAFNVAVAAQCTTLACVIDDGDLSKQYIYDSYVNFVQEMGEAEDD